MGTIHREDPLGSVCAVRVRAVDGSMEGPAMEKLEVFQGPRLAWLSRGRSAAPSWTASRGPLLADAAGEVI